MTMTVVLRVGTTVSICRDDMGSKLSPINVSGRTWGIEDRSTGIAYHIPADGSLLIGVPYEESPTK